MAPDAPMMFDSWHLARELERQQRKHDRQHACTDAGDEIELQEILRPPDAFELGTEHPQRQHVEHNVKDPAVQEHVGDELPDPEIAKDERRMQPEYIRERLERSAAQQTSRRSQR